MGFSVSATFIILLVGSLAMGAILYNNLDPNVEDLKASVEAKEVRVASKEKTVIDIISAHRPGGMFVVRVMNNGSTVLDPDKVDVLVDGQLIPSKQVVKRVEHQHSHLWCPGEVLELRLPIPGLFIGKHSIAIVTENGASAYA